MSITIDLPPAMVQEAREYATVQGTTLERLLTEDLNDGQEYCGIRAVNPFK